MTSMSNKHTSIWYVDIVNDIEGHTVVQYLRRFWGHVIHVGFNIEYDIAVSQCRSLRSRSSLCPGSITYVLKSLSATCPGFLHPLLAQFYSLIHKDLTTSLTALVEIYLEGWFSQTLDHVTETNMMCRRVEAARHVWNQGERRELLYVLRPWKRTVAAVIADVPSVSTHNHPSA